MADTKNLEKVKAVVESHMGKNYMADFTDVSSQNLGEKPCYCIHRKALISGYPVIGKIWKGDSYKIEIIKESFGPTAKKIEEDLRKAGVEAKVVMSDEIQEKEMLKKARAVIKSHLGKDYKPIFKDITPWEENVITYGIVKKGIFTESPLVAEIWTDDFRIVYKKEDFKPIAENIADNLRKEGIEARVEPDFVLKSKKKAQK